MKTTDWVLIGTALAAIGVMIFALLQAAEALTTKLEEADEDTTATYIYSTEPTTEAATEAEPPHVAPTMVVKPMTTTKVDPVAQPQYIPDYAAEMIGRTIWGEAGGIDSTAEQAAVAWCILNRVDAWGQTIEEVVTAPGQFYGYITWGDCPQEFIDLAADVLTRWEAEKYGVVGIGRVLPAEYLYFHGDGERNHYRTDYNGDGTYWDWSATDPYQN